MLKYITAILCFLLLGATAFAQTEPTCYFDKDGNTTTDSADAAFYRVLNSRDGNSFRFTEYRKDGSKVVALAEGDIKRPVYTGDVTLYFPNGKIHEKHDYAKGSPVKTLRYHQNGTLLQTILYSTATMPYTRLVYEADSTGKENIINGDGIRTETGTYMLGLDIRETYSMEGPYVGGVKNGLWRGTDDHGLDFEEIYVNDSRKNGIAKTPEGKKYKYFDIYIFPQIDRKAYEVYTFIKNNLKQPADTLLLASWRNILSLNYTVTEKGELTNIYGFNKTDHSKVYLELKKQPYKATPARLRGVPVSCDITSGYGMRFKPSGKPMPFNTDVYLNGTYRAVPVTTHN